MNQACWKFDENYNSIDGLATQIFELLFNDQIYAKPTRIEFITTNLQIVTKVNKFRREVLGWACYIPELYI